jgi:hypothetical protein
MNNHYRDGQFMKPLLEINLNWYGPYTLQQVYQLQDASCDFGVYQIYGSHTVYGSNILLYVGKAVKQTFGIRIKQEGWEHNKDSGNVQVYIGKVTKGNIESFQELQAIIDMAERMIIYSCSPARNGQSISTLSEEYGHAHLLNWGKLP